MRQRAGFPPHWAIRGAVALFVLGLALSAYLAFRLKGWYLPVGVLVAALKLWDTNRAGLGYLQRPVDALMDILLWPAVAALYVGIAAMAFVWALLGRGRAPEPPRAEADPPGRVAAPTVH